MSDRKLIVTHHDPDLDAIGACWLLKRFDAQHYADAKIAYVNAGKTIELEEAEKYQCQLHEVTHVDTGLGEFDHHQQDRAQKKVSASSFVYEHICQLHPEQKDDLALKELVDFITEVDHFHEIYWPEAANHRYVYMIHDLIRGHELNDPHNDDSQMHFGLKCLDYAYAALKQSIKADQIIKEKGQIISIKAGKALAIETRNSNVNKRAQKQGYMIVIRKDNQQGHMRITARPDAPFDLSALNQKIRKLDQQATWFYHGNGKMLLNGSKKNHQHKHTSLSLEIVTNLVKELYG